MLVCIAITYTCTLKKMTALTPHICCPIMRTSEMTSGFRRYGFVKRSVKVDEEAARIEDSIDSCTSPNSFST